MVGNYPVITLCGSTRFRNAFLAAQKRLTLEGYIVLSVGLFGHSGDHEVWENMPEDTYTRTKEMLDDMHKRKIDMADEIYVINVGDYIGESTRSEIAYARAQGKIVRYLEPHVDTVVGPVRQVTENIGDLQEDEEDMLACLQDAAQRASEPDRQPDRQPDWNDYAGLEEFLRASARGNGVSGVVPPDEATAAMIAWQTGEENDEEPQEEESAATSKEAYALQMLRDGYDIGNTAYFIGEDEAFVRALMQEHHLTEDDLRRFL